MQVATQITCHKCDAMPCGYIEQTSSFTNKTVRKYYCGYHMDEIDK